MRVAAIDIGTNSLKLLVAETGPGGLVPVLDRTRIERLGRGVDRTGALAEDAIARSLDALREYQGLLTGAGAGRTGAVATQALREVRNGEDFLAPARAILGVPVEVIGGEREAALSYAAVARAFPELASVLVCDVGGGSTELTHGEGGAVRALASVPLGAVRLTERHLHTDPPTEDEVAALVADIDRVLAAAPLPAGVPLVATGGTATTLAAVALGLEPYDAERVHGLRLDRADVDGLLRRFLGAPLAERRQVPGLSPARADVIAAGSAILARVLARTSGTHMRISDRGIRWGLAHELAGA